MRIRRCLRPSTTARVLLLLLPGATSACSLLFPVDELTGGTAPPPTTDGGSDAAAAVDGGDAGTDAAFSCPANAILCDTFERDTVLGPGSPWSKVFGKPTISKLQATSPTRSLLVAYAKASGVSFPGLGVDSAQVPAHVVVRTSIYFGKAPTDGVEIVKLAFGEVNNWDTFMLYADGSALDVAVNTYKGTSTPADVSTKTLATADRIYGTGWHVLRADIDFGANPRKATITFDQGSPVTVSVASIQPVPTRVGMSIGMTYGPDTVQVSDLYFDDFVLAPP